MAYGDRESPSGWMLGERADLILEAVDVLVERLLVADRETDDELGPGDVQAAVAAGEITVEHMAARFAQELGARLTAGNVSASSAATGEGGEP